MRPAVSVIVPVYKVEQFIGECARSLFEQTLQNVEYVFVNDCTPDASMDVLRTVIAEFPSREAAVKIVDKPQNEGLPAARRSGLAVASGEYVAHCDSDDRIEPDMFERLYNEAMAHNADGVVCGMFYNDAPLPTKYSREGENRRDFILADMIAATEMQSLCRFIFRRELYSKGVEFPVHNQGEDHATLVQLAYFSKSIFCVDKPMYHWRCNQESMTHAPSAEAVIKRFSDACANARLVEAFLAGKGLGGRYAAQVVALKLFSMFYMRPLLRLGDGIPEWRGEFPEVRGKVLCNKYISFQHKIEYLVDRYCPRSIIKTIYRWRSC